MATLVFGMSQSLDGYVDDAAGTLCMPPPRPALFRHFIDVVARHAGAIYGRRIYEVMRYWDVDRPEWDAAEREFAPARGRCAHVQACQGGSSSTSPPGLHR